MLRQIKYFQSIVRNKSFSEAAEECYISQSAISQQIQALERELGFVLLERKNRKFALTPAGELFYQKSLVLLADFNRIVIECNKIAKGSSEILRVGFLRDYVGNEFHEALAQFSLKYPEIEIQVQYGNHEELYHDIIVGTLDVILNDQRRAFSDEYVNLILTSGTCCVEVSAHSPLAELHSVTHEDLKNIPCIIISSPIQEENEREFYRDLIGFKGEFIFAENLESARIMVVSGKGFLPVYITANQNNISSSLSIKTFLYLEMASN